MYCFWAPSSHSLKTASEYIQSCAQKMERVCRSNFFQVCDVCNYLASKSIATFGVLMLFHGVADLVERGVKSKASWIKLSMSAVCFSLAFTQESWVCSSLFEAFSQDMCFPQFSRLDPEKTAWKALTRVYGNKIYGDATIMCQRGVWDFEGKNYVHLCMVRGHGIEKFLHETNCSQVATLPPNWGHRVIIALR